MRAKTFIGSILSAFVLCFSACSENEIQRPILTLKSNTGIEFNNILTYTDSINPYTYRNFYNGSGLAIGDLDNDGLDDIVFTGNQVDNAVFQNLGDLSFKDVTEGSGLAAENSWSTGVSMVDVNADGLLDIYVCKAGPPGGKNRKNQLFINQGKLKFKDEAEQYGLDVLGLSIQASFFDFDLDGDLDCYLLNNSLKSVGGYDLRPGQRDVPSLNGNKFFENKNGTFVDKTEDVGIYSSDIGFGLGIMILDVNKDGYPDIYTANDFFEKDYLYINQEGKQFKEVGEDYFASFPLGSMGVDAADLNNDLETDIFVAEMLPATLERRKTKAIFDTWEKYQSSFKKGYHYQMPRNQFYLNQFPQKFAELGRLYNCYATEWSWAPLIFDIDNDGYKDLFVSNGIGRDLLDRDYLTYMADDAKVATLIREDKKALSKLIDLMPESKVQNAIFRNDAMQQFEDVSRVWSDMPISVSNASAYSDLDRDGDLDLVIANVNQTSFLLENTSAAKNSWIGFDIVGQGQNTHSIGTTIIVFAQEQTFMVQQMPQRGFQSSVSPSLHLGLGHVSTIDSVKVNWSNGSRTILLDQKINQYNRINESAASQVSAPMSEAITEQKIRVEAIDSIEISHASTRPNDFNKDPLSIHMVAQSGPAFSVADFDKDGSSELVIGGAKDRLTHIENSTLSQSTKDLFEKKKYGAVVGTYAIDINKDGAQDLYLAHGTRMFSQYSSELNDMLLINNGNGDFNESTTGFKFPKPVITTSVSFGDIDQNGFEDVLVTEALPNNIYGLPGRGYLFFNQGANNFELQNTEVLHDVGMINTSAIADLDGDGQAEIIIAGEWMGLEVFSYKNNDLVNATDEFNLGNTNGLWNILNLVDLDKDGDLDILVGNAGSNSAYQKNMTLTVADFDGNGKPEQIVSQEMQGHYFPIHDFDDLAKQLPLVRKKFSDYTSYSTAGMAEIFGSNLPAGMPLHVLETVVFFNDAGTFRQEVLPQEIQYSSVHAIATMDVNGDDVLDIIMGGNHYNYKPQFGRDDASSGWIILGKMENDSYQFADVYPLGIEGEIRTIKPLSDTTALFGIVDRDIFTYKIKINHE